MTARRVSRPLALLAGFGLLAGAYAVAATTPDTDLVQAPFGTRAAIGEQVVSTHLIGTVNAVSLAHEVDLDLWTGTTNGIWLVLELTLDARVTRSTVDVEVLIDGVRYPATGRASSDTIDETIVDPGFPLTGPVLVELPADVLDLPGARSALIRIGPGFTTRLDGVIELVVDLTALDIDDRVELQPTREGTR